MIGIDHPTIRRRSVNLRRHGISLIEVIACTALVAVLLIPIAGVIRSSGQSMRQAQNGSTATGLRSTLTWLRQTIDDGQVVDVAGNSLQIQLSDGRMARIFVESNSLVMDDGSGRILLADHVRDIQFQTVRSPIPPRNRIGLEIRLRANDSSTGQIVSVDCTVAETPQI